MHKKCYAAFPGAPPPRLGRSRRCVFPYTCSQILSISDRARRDLHKSHGECRSCVRRYNHQLHRVLGISLQALVSSFGFCTDLSREGCFPREVWPKTAKETRTLLMCEFPENLAKYLESSRPPFSLNPGAAARRRLRLNALQRLLGAPIGRRPAI